jgi:hypothetical protein
MLLCIRVRVSHIGAAVRGGVDVLIIIGLNSVIRSAISAIADDAWTPIVYTHPTFDEETQRWISVAEVAEIPFTAFASQKIAHHVPGRLIVRRIPDLRTQKNKDNANCSTCGGSTHFSPPPTPAELDTVAADGIYRLHAIIEQVHADLKNSALAHMPSAHSCANAAWLVCTAMSFNLTRAAATLTGDPVLMKATGTYVTK